MLERVSQKADVQGGQQQDSHELLGKLIEGLLAEEVKAAKAVLQSVSHMPHRDISACRVHTICCYCVRCPQLWLPIALARLLAG